MWGGWYAGLFAGWLLLVGTVQRCTPQGRDLWRVGCHLSRPLTAAERTALQ